MADPSTTPLVTIVVVSYNTAGLLERCLAAALAGSPGVSRELRVIDNASSDGSARLVAGRWPDVQVTVNPENRGYAPACNQGLSAARGRYVLALNSDAMLGGDALGALVRRLESRPDAAAAGPRLVQADGSTQWVCARRTPRLMPSLLGHSPLPARMPVLLPYVWGTYPPRWYDQPGEPDVLSGACMLIRREALARVGLLDERLVLNYDDVEWSLRARSHGFALLYEPAAEVVHLGGMSRRFDVETNSLLMLRSTGAFWDLVFSRPASAVLKLALGASIGLSLLKNALLAPFARPRRARAAHLVRLLGQCGAMLARPLSGRSTTGIARSTDRPRRAGPAT